MARLFERLSPIDFKKKNALHHGNAVVSLIVSIDILKGNDSPDFIFAVKILGGITFTMAGLFFIFVKLIKKNKIRNKVKNLLCSPLLRMENFQCL